MACRVCKPCGVKYRNSTDFDPCPICGGETKYVERDEPDTDMDVAVQAALHVPAGRRQLLMHRRRYFYRLGFREAMLEVLVESPVDPHRMEDLLGGGCPLDVAVEILI